MTELRYVRGFPVQVTNTRPDIDTEHTFQRMDAALGVLEHYVPRRFRRMQQDVRGFVVERFACRGAFFPSEQVCLTELTFLGGPKHGIEEVAASIVHEATHARLTAMGVAGKGGNEAREERLCREAELELGLALPRADAEVVLARAVASLQLSDEDVAPRVDWRLAEQRVAEADGA